MNLVTHGRLENSETADWSLQNGDYEEPVHSHHPFNTKGEHKGTEYRTYIDKVGGKLLFVTIYSRISEESESVKKM